MEIAFFILFLAVLGLGIWLVLVLRGLKGGEGRGGEQGLLLNQINDLRRTLDSRLGESAKAVSAELRESSRLMQQQFGESARIIRDITQELTKVSEGHKQVMSITDQLKNLQDILKNPKQRGVLGEYYLETVLKNVLPPGTYQMQYGFKDGTIVDAAIFVKDRIIPVDSKFSLENYNRLLEVVDQVERLRLEESFKNDLKARIDETSKYAKPEEGTTDFAFMFIPSEAIYYDLLVNKIGAVKANTRSLIEYAVKDKKVIIVSPTSFLAYLQTVLQGLKMMQIEESAKEIRVRVEELGRHLTSYDDYMRKLGGHLGTTVNMYSKAYKEFKKVDKDVLKISGVAMNIEPVAVEGPAAEEDL